MCSTTKKIVSNLVCLCLACTISIKVVAETSIKPIALLKDKLMLSIDGKRARTLKVGQTLDGVTLIESSTEQAIVEIAGKREILTIRSGAVLSESLGFEATQDSRASAQLWADSNGFFRANGAINGSALEFIVDTGANLVVLSSRKADNLGLNYRDGILGYAATASGTAPMYMLQADEVRVAGIVLRGINMGIILGDYPTVPLLGMTFLERVDMNRSGNQMVLKKRY